MSCNINICEPCNVCIGLLVPPCKDGSTKEILDMFDDIIQGNKLQLQDSDLPYIVVKYNAKNKLDQNYRMTAKIVLYGDYEVHNDYRIIDANKTIWSIIDGSIVKYKHGVFFHAVASYKSKRIA